MHVHRRAVVAPKGRRELFEAIVPSRDEQQRCAATGQPARKLVPDTGACARDDDRLRRVVENHVWNCRRKWH